MFPLKNKLLAVAVASSMAVLISAPSHAAVMASSVLKHTNFQILDASTNTQLKYTDFAGLTFVSSADYSGDIKEGAISTNFSTSSSVPQKDFPMQCVGTGCAGWGTDYGAENSFTQLQNAGFPNTPGNYAAADQFENGTPITGIPGLETRPTSSTAEVGAYTGGTIGTVDASAIANNNLNSSFIFSLNKDMGLLFSFDIAAYLQAYVTVDEKFPGFATASYQFDLSLEDLGTAAAPTSTTIWSLSPDVFGGSKTISINAPTIFGDREIIKIGSKTYSTTQNTAAATTPQLFADHLYQLSIREQVNADSGRVPEPGILSLLGIGLMGLGFQKRRQKESLVF